MRLLILIEGLYKLQNDIDQLVSEFAEGMDS